MIPLLFEAHYDPSSEQYPARLSLGRLSDALSCVITEDLNGCYELEITYPVNGLYTAQLMQPCTIAALRPYADGNEYKRELAWFDVYRRTIENGIMTVNAYHISYRLSRYAVYRLPGTQTTASGAAGAICNVYNVMPTGLIDLGAIRVTADPIPIGAGYFVFSGVKSCREYLFDDTYSVRKVFKAEPIYHGTSLHLAERRGEDRGVEIRYGKNLTGGTITRDETESYNALYAYYKRSDGFLIDAVVYSDPQISPVNLHAVDFGSYFDAEPTAAQVRAVAEQYMADNTPWLSRETADITFDPDWQQGAAGGTVREVIDLGDTVSVFYGDADLAGAKLRVVRIRYDVLLEHFSEFTLGQLERGYAVTSRDGLSATRQIMA